MGDEARRGRWPPSRLAVEGKYKKRIDEASQDPGKQQRIRDEMTREINAVKKSYTKFEGQKSGWDVSIIGPEFQQGTGGGGAGDQGRRLDPLLLLLRGRALQDVPGVQQGRPGRASRSPTSARAWRPATATRKAVYRDDKTKGGINHVLDHFDWNAGPDRLKLVDRSEFYGVYCLVLYDQSTHERVAEKRKIVNPGTVEKDELVESVTNRGKRRERRERRHHRSRRRPRDQEAGDEEHADIVVPSTSGKARQPLRGERQELVGLVVLHSEGSKKKASKKSNDPMDGLEL